MTMENQDIGKQDPMVNSQISGDLKMVDLSFTILTSLTKKSLNFNLILIYICTFDFMDLRT